METSTLPSPPLPAQLEKLRKAIEDTLRNPALIGSHAPKPAQTAVERSIRQLALQQLDLAHQRARLFGDDADLFGDPAWLTLLTLFVAHKRHPVPISVACDGSGSPHTTALRYITRLEERRYVARRQNPADRRSRFIELTARGEAVVRSVLQKQLKAALQR